jgi:hypothetical protein
VKSLLRIIPQAFIEVPTLDSLESEHTPRRTSLIVEKTTIGNVPLITPCVLAPGTNLLEALTTFEEQKSHMALVSHEPRILLQRLKHDIAADEGMVRAQICLIMFVRWVLDACVFCRFWG